MIKLNLVELSVDDWSALYVNGEVVDQDHSVDYLEVTKSWVSRGIMIESYNHYEVTPNEGNEDLCNYGNRFPEKLEDCIEYMELIKNLK